jgi:hypothetical protein
LSFTLPLKYLAHFETFSLVDSGLALALGVQNFGTLYSLRLSLEFHAAPDLLWRLDVFQLVAQHLNTPSISSILKCRLDLHIEVVSLFKGAVQVDKTNFRAHAGLSEERHGINCIVDSIRCLVCVRNAVVKNSINLDLDVVFCDGSLGGNVEDLFLKAVHVSHGLK